MAAGGIRVDEVDFRILREIFTGAEGFFRTDRIPADAVARNLGIHRNTVAARIRRLGRAGVFLPPTIDLEPGLVGLVAAKAFLDVPPTRRQEETREALFRLEGVAGILSYLDGWDVMVFAEDEPSLASRIEVARLLTGASRVVRDHDTATDYPGSAEILLSPLDVRLVALLLADGRASFRRLAAEAGVTGRTLERRFEALRAAGLLAQFPRPFAGLEGISTACLTAGLPASGTARERVLRELSRLLPNHWVRNVAARSRAHYFLFSPSLDHLQSQWAAAQRIPGVGEVTFRILLAHVANPAYPGWLVRTLERRARARPGARSSGGAKARLRRPKA